MNYQPVTVIKELDIVRYGLIVLVLDLKSYIF